ncbi:MAG: DUF6989 domain-containing protein [Candidatus Kariarchaeaceae archaeon]|jgi:hypothetical protein
MRIKISIEEKEVILLHVVFSLICGFVMIPNFQIDVGVQFLILVLLYDFLVLGLIYYRKYKHTFTIWLFAALLSLFQVIPDWILSEQLNVLVFPEDGVSKIGTVSIYMAGLWTIPIFILIFIGESIRLRYSGRMAYYSVSLCSLIIFSGSEMTLWRLGSWKAQNVTMFNHLAIYIILPEILLGLSAYWAYEKIQDERNWLKLPVSFLVMLLYVGAAVTSYFLLEQQIL